MPSELAEVSPAQEERDGVQAYLWDVEAFYRAVRAGVFARPERLELIEGEIVETVAAQETPRVQSVHLCAEELRAVAEPVCHVRAQSPLDVSRRTEPEPDVMLVRGRLRDYDGRKPTPADVLLLVEVADATLGYDRGRKAALYAAVGITDYWILNLRARALEIHRDPAPTPGERHGFGYRTRLVLSESEAAYPLAVINAKVEVHSLLPAEPL